MGNLNGKVALVTGAGSGIGRGSAVALAAAGAAVVVNDINPVGLEETCAVITRAGGRCECVLGDVSKTEEVNHAIQFTVSRMGGLDIVHANAGVERYVELEKMNDTDLNLLLDVDLKGVLLCFRAGIPELRKRGGGVLLATSSVQATHSLPGCVVYAAAKAAVCAAVRTLSLEVGRDGIRVISISPGTIDTPMLTRDLEDMNVSDAENFLGRVKSANSLGSIGTCADIGNMVVFLASPEAAYVTGTDIVVDGGFTAVKQI